MRPPRGDCPISSWSGSARAGTTSLFNYLGQHRDVGTSDVKELRYFTAVRHGQPLAPLETYSAHFAGCTQTYAMEATPGYFCGGAAVASALRQTCPSAHTLVSLRKPEDRCWSWFQFVKSRGRIPKEMTFAEYLDRCETLNVDGRDGDLDQQPFWGLGGGCYSEWLEAWLRQFGERFRVTFFDDLMQDPGAEVKAICAWLAIDTDRVDDFQFAATNRSEQYKNWMLQKGAVALNRHGERFFRRHSNVKRQLRRAYYSLNSAPGDPQMSRGDEQRLAAFYRPYNVALSDQLATRGLRLPPSWWEPSSERRAATGGRAAR